MLSTALQVGVALPGMKLHKLGMTQLDLEQGGWQGRQFWTPRPKNLQYSVTKDFRGSSFDFGPPAKFLGGSNAWSVKLLQSQVERQVIISS